MYERKGKLTRNPQVEVAALGKLTRNPQVEVAALGRATTRTAKVQQTARSLWGWSDCSRTCPHTALRREWRAQCIQLMPLAGRG